MSGQVTGPSILSMVLCLSLVLLLLMPMCAHGQGPSPVARENPGTAIPSRSQPVDDQITALLEKMMGNLDDISAAVEGGNFTAARASYSTFSSSFSKYNNLLWQLNLSESDYRSIAGQMNFTDDQVRGIIDAAEDYQKSSAQYGRELSAGDLANASLDAARARESYANVSAAYGGLRNNATLLGRVLTDRGLDTGHLDSSIGSLDRVMAAYSETYGNLSIAASGASLSLSTDRTNLSVGDEVIFRATLKNANGTPVYGGKVVVSADGDPAGFFMTDFAGEGWVGYTVPINVSGDHLPAYAEYMPSSGPVAMSNYVDLYIRDLPATVTLTLDRDNASFGDVVNVAGGLTAGGRPMPGRPIDISLNGSPVASVKTGEDGSYAYALRVGPSTPAGQLTINASYYRKPGDLLLNASSPENILSIGARPTLVTITAPEAVNPGGIAGFTGSLTTDNGLPVAGAGVTVYIDGAEAGRGMTDAGGNYRVAAMVPQNASTGGHDVYAGFSPGPGMALKESSSAPAVVLFQAGGPGPGEGGIPFEWYVDVALGALILVAVAVAAMLIYRSYAVRKPREATEAIPTAVVTPAALPEKAAFNVEEEADMIRSLAGPDARAAATRAYLASRGLLASAGLKLGDSMTHHEAYRAASAMFPEASQPFEYIVDLYEQAVFAGRPPTSHELEQAIYGLKEAAVRLRPREGGP